MLEVLDQHHPTARTVASLAASVLSTHADPAWRTERLSLARLRRAALISAAMAAPLALVLGRSWAGPLVQAGASDGQVTGMEGGPPGGSGRAAAW